jgi:hypothetical protein
MKPPHLSFLLLAAAAMTSCTGGYITTQSGAQWTPAIDGSGLKHGVVTFSNASGTYQIWSNSNSTDTVFSWDMYAPTKYTGNYETQQQTQVPNGKYTVTVADNYLWKATGVVVDNTVACPYDDYYTGQSGIECQLFQLDLLNCGVKAKAPYVSGSFTVVEMNQQNSGQCGPRSCVHNVVNVGNSYFTDPKIVEVYVGCTPGLPGCTVAPNTGLWATLSNSTGFWSRMVEYNAGSGSYGGAYSITSFPVPTNVSDSDAFNLLQLGIATGQVKSPYTFLDFAHPTIFVMYLPSTSCSGTCDGTSHHFWTTGSDGQIYDIALMAPYTPSSYQDAVATHEVSEATTDVDDYNPGCGTNTGCGWNDPGNGEIVDLCGSLTETIQGYNVAQVWSQRQCTCL